MSWFSDWAEAKAIEVDMTPKKKDAKAGAVRRDTTYTCERCGTVDADSGWCEQCVRNDVAILPWEDYDELRTVWEDQKQLEAICNDARLEWQRKESDIKELVQEVSKWAGKAGFFEGLLRGVLYPFGDREEAITLARRALEEVGETEEKTYPCADCGTLRTKAEGGTTFTYCDECWDARRILDGEE